MPVAGRTVMLILQSGRAVRKVLSMRVMVKIEARVEVRIRVSLFATMQHSDLSQSV